MAFHYISMSQSNVIIALIIVVLFFLVLLIVGLFKTLKLKSENKILTKKSVKKKEVYRDFTEGHLY